jgi:hypothetical protein
MPGPSRPAGDAEALAALGLRSSRTPSAFGAQGIATTGSPSTFRLFRRRTLALDGGLSPSLTPTRRQIRMLRFHGSRDEGLHLIGFNLA